MDLFEGYHPDPHEDPVTMHWRQALGGNGHWHDFSDGHGPVPAHRHLNPDKGYGGLGGWVANTAHVDPTAYIDKEAEVGGRAQIGKNTWMQRHSKALDDCVIGGPVIIGPHVHFGGHAQARFSNTIKHPIFIGYSPLMTAQKFNGKNSEGEPMPILECKSYHPVINRWRKADTIYTMIMLDNHIIVDTVERGYSPIDDFNEIDNDGLPMNIYSPHDRPYRSWRDAEHMLVYVYESDNIVGQSPKFPEKIERLMEAREILRVGKMPNTVASPRLYMRW